MNLLPHSNGVRKVNMKRQRTPQEKIKLVGIVFLIIIGFGFLSQRVINFIAKETLKPKVEYTTVDERRMDYRLKGSGNYTIVFDGAIGGNLEAWTPVVSELEDENVMTFTYNRHGYGYSDDGGKKTIEEQAQDLKILLRKSGASEPYILVGEEYGSLVLTSFAKQFPESVAGVVLVNPIDEASLVNGQFKKENTINKLRRKIEKIGSGFGLTTLLDKLNLDVNLDDFESRLPEEYKNEFAIQRTKKKYTSAVYNELCNLTKGLSDSQNEGVFKDKPYCLITRDDTFINKNLGTEELTKVLKITNEKSFLSLNDSEMVLNGISDVLKKIKEIDRKKN